MTFYFILCLLFSLMYGVLGLGNYKVGGKFRIDFNKWETDTMKDPEMSDGAPGLEYKKVGMFFGNYLQTMRISMGDFSCIAASDYLSPSENYLFWFIWTLTTIITCIIFLNFIVAEASASYNEVSEDLDNYIWQQKADLTAEAESLIPNSLKRANFMPKFIIIRKIET
jgi:hypothetical protein